jgi:hypothetical protein
MPEAAEPREAKSAPQPQSPVRGGNGRSAEEIAQDTQQLAEQLTHTSEEVASRVGATVSVLQAVPLTLASKRTHAYADYLDEVGRARHPAELINAGAHFWSRFIQDYTEIAANYGVPMAPGQRQDH